MYIEHIAIWTNQLEQMKEFYVQYFNGKANEKYLNPFKQFESYFITFEQGARLELMYKPTIPLTSYEKGVEVTGITHLSFAVGSRERVDFLTELLRKQGVQVVGEPRQTGDGYYESIILDPDGNRIEIMA